MTSQVPACLLFGRKRFEGQSIKVIDENVDRSVFPDETPVTDSGHRAKYRERRQWACSSDMISALRTRLIINPVVKADMVMNFM